MLKVLLMLRAWYWEVRYFNLVLECMEPIDCRHFTVTEAERLYKSRREKKDAAEMNMHSAHEDLRAGSALPLYTANDHRIARRKGITVEELLGRKPQE